jgi:anthranilate synthase component 2
MHGKTSKINHNGKGLFRGLNSGFEATRYHSLIVKQETLPAALEVTASTDDGLIMGVQHRTMPVHGVQFHPESIASENGHALLQNFLNIARDFNLKKAA